MPIAHSVGAALGEPVADDFDFLYRALVEQGHSLFDGGGSLQFWRPLAHQIYYQIFGSLILEHPSWIAAIHAVFQGGVTLTLFATFRRLVQPASAAVIATFPLFAESARGLISWPSHFVELGVIALSVLALHETVRGRLMTAMASLAAALLCKEMALITALFLPWIPQARDVRSPQRSTWVIGTGVVVVSWAVAYTVVRTKAELNPSAGVTTSLGVLAGELPVRLAWSVWNSVKASFSLAQNSGTWDTPVLVAGLVILGLAVGFVMRSKGSRQDLRQSKQLVAWGCGWFLISCLALTVTHPVWAPHRSLFGSLGLGVALVPVLRAGHPALLIALVALRLFTFAVSPGPARTVSPEPPATGSFIDFAKLTRLQRFMRVARQVLESQYPRLPTHAHVGQHYFPQATEYALSGDKALQTWYRDSTLRWVRFEELNARPETPLVTIIEYQPSGNPQAALVEPNAMRRRLAATAHLHAGRWPEAIAEFTAADSLQRDQGARVFTASNAYQRAFCRAALGDDRGAETEARTALRLGQVDANARYVLALVYLSQERQSEANAQLDSLLAKSPGDADALELKARIGRGGAP